MCSIFLKTHTRKITIPGCIQVVNLIKSCDILFTVFILHAKAHLRSVNYAQSGISKLSACSIWLVIVLMFVETFNSKELAKTELLPGMLPPFATQSDETRAMAKHCTVGVELRVSAERLILLDAQVVICPCWWFIKESQYYTWSV